MAICGKNQKFLTTQEVRSGPLRGELRVVASFATDSYEIYPESIIIDNFTKNGFWDVSQVMSSHGFFVYDTSGQEYYHSHQWIRPRDFINTHLKSFTVFIITLFLMFFNH
jgi:hypothetical protein